MEISVLQHPVADHETPCLILGVVEGKPPTSLLQRLDEALDGVIGRAADCREFRGETGRTLLVHGSRGLACERLLLVGLGKEQELSAESLRRAAALAAATVRERRLESCSLALAHLNSRLPVAVVTEAWVEGLQLADYRFERYLAADPGRPAPLARLTLLADSDSTATAVRQSALRSQAVCQGVFLARDLVNEPGNIKSPAFLAERATQLAAENDLECTILDRGALEREGFGALLGVAQGSLREPRLIQLNYRGATDEQPVILIGKGVVFDSGGISLKPGENMDQMKMDMAGAATVFGTLLTTALLRLPVNLTGLVPAVENMPSGNALRPGDILTSLSGKTIEVLNTDAEGRLILADALSYAQRFAPREVIDVATLTGACVIALGHHAAALLGNHQGLLRRLRLAGEVCGERLWPLPLWKEYGQQLKSEIADLKNIGGRPAGTITAAAFLEHFARDFRWAHLDIAGTAWQEKAADYRPVGATGFGVRLLVTYLSRLCGGTEKRPDS